MKDDPMCLASLFPHLSHLTVILATRLEEHVLTQRFALKVSDKEQNGFPFRCLLWKLFQLLRRDHRSLRRQKGKFTLFNYFFPTVLLISQFLIRS